MVCFVGVRKFWLRQAVGYAAAVGTLVGQQEFWNAEDVIRGKQLVEVRFREVQRVMAFEPGAQLRRILESINKLIARRNGILLLHFLHDLGVAPCKNIKRELTHRLRSRRRWRD